MKRAALLLVTGLVLAGCGSAKYTTSLNGPRGITHMRPVSPTSLRFSTASNRDFAHRDVKTLLRIVVLPPSARQVSRAPKDAPDRLRRDFSKPGVASGIAFAHRLWVVDEPVGQVLRYVRAHARPRPRPLAQFRSKTNGVAFRESAFYEFPQTPGRSTWRYLDVQMIPLRGGKTVVFAQAADQWIRLSPASAVLSSKVRRIDIRSSYGGRHANVLVHVRDRFEVARIVARVNGLGRTSARVLCLAQFVGGPSVTLTFRAADGAVLASAQVSDPGGSGESGPCNPLQLTVGARKAVPLIGADLVHWLQQDLQIDLAPVTPGGVRSCLAGGGWKVQSVAHNSMVAKVQHFSPELTVARDGHRWLVTFHATGKVTTSPSAPRALARCIRNRPPLVTYG